MTIGPSIYRGSDRRGRRLVAVFAVVLAVVLTGLGVIQRLTVGPPGAPVADELFRLRLVAVPTLAAVGAASALRASHRDLWLVTGCLLLVAVVPPGLGAGSLLVASFVLVGAVEPVLSGSRYETAFAGGLLLALLSVGTEAYAQLAGAVSVMVPVGGAIVFGATVAALAATNPSERSRADRRPTRSRGGPRSRLVSGLATDRGWYPVWGALVAWSAVVCVLHFGGMRHGLYGAFSWWDLTTHTLSGFGVAAWLYLLRPAAYSTRRRLFVFLPAVVFLVGAGFEVYEFLFRGFYEPWSVDYYLRDTVEDMLCNVAGAAALAGVCHLSGDR
ncbi:hypothetical protein GJ633_06445 [Halorubrum sp. CBA1125]|uniref:hypothetical protein n=1 Tax=Halorubrum sp. CBA1125 TaxID=2668072 RepID=UPI0012E733FB|nr:hypothetical protein [Halorubrum sp. CBA1125]MUW14338.1 hypothetical protein [Halorubrum sp. CBA1125]